MSTNDRQIIFSLVGVGRIHPPKKQVLKDIYMSFFYGAKIGVLGLNGSGKSTRPAVAMGATTTSACLSRSPIWNLAKR